MRKIEIKAGWEGLSICVVLEEKFEQRFSTEFHKLSQSELQASFVRRESL